MIRTAVIAIAALALVACGSDDESRFVDHGDGTVTDRRTGLVAGAGIKSGTSDVRAVRSDG